MTVDTSVLPIHTRQKAYVSTSVGHKAIMAVTGLVLFGYVVGHLLGNLQIFIGQNQINAYAQFLKDTPLLTYTARVLLLVAVILHIWNAVRLYFENRASRPVRYVCKDTVQATLSSRTMFWSGLGIFMFVVYHLLHFTFIATNPQYKDLHDALGRHDVYSMIILGFQNRIISTVYLVSVFLVCYHLSHSIQSFFQTLGLNNERTDPFFRKLSVTVATLIFIGYTVIPLAVLTGIIMLPGEGH
ncbi:MAG: succinate dehydrogenase cytochrome b subunit [Candidatus Zixiibacteriota bacterium]